MDNRLLSQVFTNILKNAVEAIDAVPSDVLKNGMVTLRARQTSTANIIVEILDNGKGLPIEGRNRLLEPYMTTREKGTGLGLAIVRKILQDHGASIELLDNPQAIGGGDGANINLVFEAIAP